MMLTDEEKDAKTDLNSGEDDGEEMTRLSSELVIETLCGVWKWKYVWDYVKVTSY